MPLRRTLTLALVGVVIVVTVLTRGVHFVSDSAGGVIWALSLTPFIWVLWAHLVSWLAHYLRRHKTSA